MNFNDIKDKRLTGNILILGNPGTGKTRLSKLMADNHPDHQVIHTDEFGLRGHEEGLYTLMRALKEVDKPTIIEGIMGARLLRKGLQTGTYLPDTVIEMNTPTNTVVDMYKRERIDRDPKYLQGLRTTNAKILKDYRNQTNLKPPAWLFVDNEY